MGTQARARNAPAEDDAKAILNRIRQLVRALRAFDKEAQSKYGVGAAQMFILHVLHGESELSINELAHRTATDQSSVSLAVGRLVEDGYVRRDVSPDDRRQVRLLLSPKGRALVRRTPPAAQAKIMKSVSGMTAADRAHLIKLLDRLMSGMDVAGSQPSMLFQEDETNLRKR